MKNYVKPSIELTKFNVEDIITASGVAGTKSELTGTADSIYTEYLKTGATEQSTFVEFEW